MWGPLPRLDRGFCSTKCKGEYQSKVPSGKKGKKYPHLQRARIGICVICRREFRATNDFKERKQKYCSKECWGKRNPPQKRKCKTCGNIFIKRVQIQNGSPALYCSKKCYDNDSESTLRKHKGGLAPAWKGNDVGYHGLHKWIQSRLGKPTACEHCGKKNLTGSKIHWSNKYHTYKRRLKDWQRLCAQCHSDYDRKKML
jgi:hypothetical protein